MGRRRRRCRARPYRPDRWPQSPTQGTHRGRGCCHLPPRARRQSLMLPARRMRPCSWRCQMARATLLQSRCHCRRHRLHSLPKGLGALTAGRWPGPLAGMLTPELHAVVAAVVRGCRSQSLLPLGMRMGTSSGRALPLSTRIGPPIPRGGWLLSMAQHPHPAVAGAVRAYAASPAVSRRRGRAGGGPPCWLLPRFGYVAAFAAATAPPRPPDWPVTTAPCRRRVRPVPAGRASAAPRRLAPPLLVGRCGRPGRGRLVAAASVGEWVRAGQGT